jgi:ribosomal protein S18 acetylase RimI-like enzyme
MTIDDPLLAWSAQDGRAGTRTWTRGDATAIAYPALSRRDRIAVRGSVRDVTAWLDRTDDVAALLDAAFPDSYARPGADGVRRWAGIRHNDELVATAAEAWSVRDVGFMAGVTTRIDARGRGLAKAICGFVTDELLKEHPRVALFADYWNEAAIATYRALGFRLRPLAAAHQR